MKHLSKILSALLLSLLLCIPSVVAVFYYTRPMKDVSYTLFSLGGDGEEWKGANGWTFYKNEKGKQTELISDGFGGYYGLTSPGQTFYYSRKLKETLDSPTLKIATANRTVSVFINNKLIYTDCPEQDNRIGYLELPMLEYDRTEPVTVSLPPDYKGKTLTIAQSSPILSETLADTNTVWPCEVTLYCGYAYESGLIASASKTMLPAVLLFSLELFLLAVFIWNASMGIFLWKFPVFALAIFLQTCSILIKADFFFQYFGLLDIDYSSLCFYGSVGVVLLLLALYARKWRGFFLFLSVSHLAASLMSMSIQSGHVMKYGNLSLFLTTLPQITGLFTLLAALIASFFLAKTDHFFRHFFLTAASLLTGYALFLMVSIPFSPEYVSSVFTRIRTEFSTLIPVLSVQILWNLVLLSTLAAVLLDFIEQETNRRSEREILTLKNELAMESYKNLQMQSEEIQMLRHDTSKHYHLLRTMAEQIPEKIPAYLDDLISQTDNVRPVVACQNQVLNILLNGKLNAAAAKGIRTETVRCDAPAKLPLTDSALCCLIVNILDNAILAASSSASPYLKLDFHCKDQHFVFSCENSTLVEVSTKQHSQKDHGYGLKIIRQIMHRFGDNMVSVEQTENTYKITIIIPL